MEKPSITILTSSGLTHKQAILYLTLIEHGEQSPAALARLTNESRTNTYMLCEKMASLGLISRTSQSKTTYVAAPPTVMRSLIEKRRKEILQDEKIVREGMGSLLTYYYEKRHTPGVVTRYGRDGINALYESIIEDGHEQIFIQSPHDGSYMGESYYRHFGERRKKAGIASTALSVSDPKTHAIHTAELDKAEGITQRTWLNKNDYKAPVEWIVHHDKVSAITFTDQPIALTIHSPYIAESMRQIIALVRRADPDKIANNNC